MSDKHISSGRVIQSLEIANRCLQEAEDILWNTATTLPNNTKGQELEELTEEIWTIQHQINDLQREIE